MNYLSFLLGKKHIRNYFRLAVFTYIVLSLLRVLEIVSIPHSIYSFKTIFIKEVTGLFIDLCYANLFLVLFLPLYKLLYNYSVRLSNIFFIGLVLVYLFYALPVLEYFFYQQIPLDTFFYKYTKKEILFTINTSGKTFLKPIVEFFIISLIGIGAFLLMRDKEKVTTTKKVWGSFTVLSVLVVVILILRGYPQKDSLVLNKPGYFARVSIGEFFKNEDKEQYTQKDLSDFRELFGGKDYIGKKYPLLHQSKRGENNFAKLFEKFDKRPNVVLLIVEGLSDDYLNNYHDTLLMPFLNDLSKRSLYWNRCFTLGERSFAAVPCLLGGLPYGNKGFTLEKRLPYHYSLVSILKQNNYYASFFYGQWAWFHQKDRFFTFNNADLVFDSRYFNEKYSKIIVGPDKYFWGYNDRSLYNQYFEVLDTLKTDNHIDVFFTGSTHGPFVIDNDSAYSEKLIALTPKNQDQFFKDHRAELKSVLFSDDELKRFFDEYKSKKDYENTIFIITGDHPMSELPSKNRLKKYHVPLIVFSEKIKLPKLFNKYVNHLDLYESLLEVFQQYDISMPGKSTSLGYTLVDKNEHKSFFMDDNRDVHEYLKGKYFLTNDVLYEVNPNLDIKKINNKVVLDSLKNDLKIFNQTSLNTCHLNNILSVEDYCTGLGYQKLFSKGEEENISTNRKYFTIVPKMIIKEKNVVLNFNIKQPLKKGVQIVCEIKSSTNKKPIAWKVNGADAGTYFWYDMPIPKNIKGDLFFEAYFFNPEERKYDLKIENVLLYQK